jgi:hypothetical protein
MYKFISTGFTIDAENLAYRLGLPAQTEIDFWDDKTSKKIFWEAFVESNLEGISAIKAKFTALHIILTFRVMTDDLRSKDITRLTEDNQMFETGDFQEGLIHINTMTEKDWNIIFDVEAESGVMMPTQVHIDFMDKIIQVI